MAHGLTLILMTYRIFFRHKFRRSNRQTMPGWQSPMMRELRIQLVIDIPATQKISVRIFFRTFKLFNQGISDPDTNIGITITYFFVME